MWYCGRRRGTLWSEHSAALRQMPKRLKEETRIEILQLPLDASLHPTQDLSTSQGRFVAVRKAFLDPATIPPGTFITITGDIAGSITLPLDETEYTYPLVMINTLRVWTNTEEDEAPRIRRPIGPGPYWGPYWSPYWYPWPYYWRETVNLADSIRLQRGLYGYEN